MAANPCDRRPRTVLPDVDPTSAGLAKFELSRLFDRGETVQARIVARRAPVVSQAALSRSGRVVA